ncbi:hypothetical protein SSS_09906 [Sarcoptes scabiei]|nr:hypothetical protein SSS_09906 [Sarcoptes scabiei]
MIAIVCIFWTMISFSQRFPSSSSSSIISRSTSIIEQLSLSGDDSFFSIWDLTNDVTKIDYKEYHGFPENCKQIDENYYDLKKQYEQCQIDGIEKFEMTILKLILKNFVASPNRF